MQVANRVGGERARVKFRNMFLESILIISIVAFLIPQAGAVKTPCGNFTTNQTGSRSDLFMDIYTNNLNQNASDLCAKYEAAWAENPNPNLGNLTIINPPGCPDDPMNAIGDGIILIDWSPNACVAPGDDVGVIFWGNAPQGLWRDTLIWTLNGDPIGSNLQKLKINPIKPPPVKQHMGLDDRTINSLQTSSTDQSVCRSCHQTTGTNISGGYNNTIGGVPTRHHNLLPEGLINPYTNSPFGCTDCHPSTPGIGNGILLDRSCLDCHNGTNFWADSIGAHVGNITRPHHVNTTYDDAHIGNPAENRTCNFCHGSFVDNYNDGHYKPAYDTDFMITPYATYKITNFSQTNPIPVFDSYGNRVLNKTWGGCESCHLADSNVVDNNANTHHTAVNGSLANKGGDPIWRSCTWCHITTVDSVVDENKCVSQGGTWIQNDQNWGGRSYCIYVSQATVNPSGEKIPNAIEVRNSTIEQADAAIGAFEPGTTNITINGTGCEKCHSVKSIHNIQFNYSQNGPDGFGHINNNTDCYGCHNSWLPADSWTPGALIPTVDDISPSVMTVGTATTLSITGSNFVNDVTNPDGTVSHYTSDVTIDGIKYTPTSITDNQIVVNIPALSAGVHQLQLVKGGDTLSKLSTMTVVNNPTITSATLSPGKNGQPATITITGKGFGTKPTNATMYVSVNHAGNQIISSSVSRWSDTQITARNTVATSGDVLTVLTANAGEATQIIQ